MTKRLFGILLLCFSPVTLVHAGEIMFEGYYRVELENKPIGYTILRYEFDAASNSFEAKSFLRVKFGDKIVQESTKAKATNKFKPLAYQYTSQVGDEMKMIDVTFNGEVMTAKISDGKKVRTEVSKIPKGTFLSSFLPYLMLQKKLELNENFVYSAVAEEDAGSFNGKAWLQAKESKPGYDVFTVVNQFKNEKFISKMAIVKDAATGKNVKGEVIATSSPTKNLSTRLVASAALATEGQIVPNKTLLAVFGNVPTGKVNMVATPSGTTGGSSLPPEPTTPPDVAEPDSQKTMVPSAVPPSNPPSKPKIRK